LGHGVTELLVPFFLVGIGLHLDLAVFRDWTTLMLAVVILLVACLAKFVGCGLGAARLGRADATRIGVGMMPRGEVGLVVAQVGLSMGVIPQNIYAVVVFMSIGSTLVAPPLLRIAFRGLIRTEAKVAELPRVG
jgi:Kef-type K+ transport system membrane component KefB